ncbi:MAG: YedE-related selenium metabolism membrane protein [Candidatus Adiutrix sp.]|jgi:YedE family putative selenium metabolism protein|nr:YedE-related selenium metabolism membrane protein [Candidatus Adiutrix sp.]
MKNFFASNKGLIVAGALIGLIAVCLQKLGNPGNMGVCVVCFERDLAGSLGLHRAEIVQYARPEIFALALGSFGAALFFGEFRPRGGSSPVVRFFLGAVVAVGALVFLGCPWRALLRLAGGDWNAIFGLAGLICGVAAGAVFFRQNYSLGRNLPGRRALGLIFPLFMLALLGLRLTFPQIEGEAKNDLLFYSLTGPGSMHAAFGFSLAAGLIIGLLGQRSRFCAIGAFRDLILFRQAHLFLGVLGFLGAAFVGNLALGQFHPGFENQPIAHTQSLWNFLGLFTAGLASALAGGCPARQLFLAGEGDGDAACFVLGLMGGAAMAHNWSMASSGAGIGPHGMAAVVAGLVLTLFIGLMFRAKNAA